MPQDLFLKLIQQMQRLQLSFFKVHGVDDIWSNSKVYEIIIANSLGHNLIPGHSGSRDANNEEGIDFEYKHYKELSSNHSWTFNDYSDSTINKLFEENYNLIFAHINDRIFPPNFGWYYQLQGKEVSNYLSIKTKSIRNSRKMINLSSSQIENFFQIPKQIVKQKKQKYKLYIDEIFNITRSLEELTNVKNVLTSNKFWEIFVAQSLGHQVNSEQGGRKGAHDAYDKLGNSYEYKISKTFSWNFQDISENVLEKYKEDRQIILGVIDKKNFLVKKIYGADPETTIERLREKLKEKEVRFKKLKKEVRRKQVSLSKRDLQIINAIEIKPYVNL